MNELPHVVLDTETTGFAHKKGDRVIEVAAARFDPSNGELLETFHRQVNPGFPIEAQATAIHGITNEMLESQPGFEAVFAELSGFVAGTHVIIHNAPFDVGFLDHEYQRLKQDRFAALPARITCSRQLARRVLPPSQKSRLDSLCDLFGIDRSARTLHGALIDCALLAQVYPRLEALRVQRDQVLAQLMPFAPGAALPEDIDELGRSYTMLNALVNQLKAEQERIRAVVEERLNGVNYDHRDFTVSFNPRCTTDWKKVTEKHLQGVDLKPYQKKGTSMTIEST